MNVEVTDVAIQLAQDGNVVAYGSITLGHEWALRKVRVIKRPDGSLFVAMPSEEETTRCPGCVFGNRLSALFCNRCGVKLPTTDVRRFRDLAFPVSPAVRESAEAVILAEYARLSRTVDPPVQDPR